MKNLPDDTKMFKWLAVLIVLPLLLAIFGAERFRYPCQDPANWDKDFCKVPICDVTRTCPEHIFKGQRDPRLGPPKDGVAAVAASIPPVASGSNCGK